MPYNGARGLAEGGHRMQRQRPLVGAAFYAACFACFWASSLAVRQSAADVPFFLHYTSRAVQIATCLLVAALAWRRGVGERSLRRGTVVAVTAYGIVEVVRLMGGSLLPSSAALTLNVLGGATNGVSVALMLLLFLRALCMLGTKTAAVVVPASFACSHVLFLALGFLPAAGGPWAKVVLLLVSAVGFAVWLRHWGSDVLPATAWREVQAPAPAFGPPLANLTLWLGMVVFPLLYGFMAQICAASGVSSGLFDVSTEVVDIVFMVALAAVGLLWRDRLDAEATFAIILSVFATAFLFLPVFWGNGVFVAGFIMKCGFSVYTVFLWLSLVRMGVAGPGRCFCMFGLVLGIYHGALMVGRLCAHVLTMNQLLSYQTLSLAALAVVWLLSMAALVVILTNRRFRVREEEAHAEKPRDYDEAFDAFADACGLSGRERSVCREYARGRTVEYIAESLAVSQETVKTHLKRAYAKCGCHGRQDLIDRIDQHRVRMTAGE